jgi:hypothetical protein
MRLQFNNSNNFRRAEAEEVLSGNLFSKTKNVDEIETEFGSMSCHALSILGAIFR